MARPASSLGFLSFLLILLSVFLLCVSVAGHGGGNDDDDADSGDAGAAAEAPLNLRARPLVLAKIWCLILVFVGTFAGGISPYFFKWNELFLALGTQFAGGVFLGTALMHFLSDAAETFGRLTEKEYPFAFMLASAGYLLTMLADCVISAVVSRQPIGGGGREGTKEEASEGGGPQITGSNGVGYPRTDVEFPALPCPNSRQPHLPITIVLFRDVSILAYLAVGLVSASENVGRRRANLVMNDQTLGCYGVPTPCHK